LAFEFGRMTIHSFIFAYRPTVLSNVCALQIEVALAVSNNFLVNGSVSAIVLDLAPLSSDLKPDVLPSPSAYLRSLHFAIRPARLVLHVALLMSAVVCEKSYYKGKGKDYDIDFNRLAEHTFCFNSMSNRFARFWCKLLAARGSPG
jgi:hypothetical protein